MTAMIVSALLSAIHLLTLALGLGAVFARSRALAGTLDAAGWQRLLAADLGIRLVESQAAYESTI